MPPPTNGTQALGNITGAVTIDVSKAQYFTGTLTGNVTITVTNGLVRPFFVLDFTQDGVGGRTVTITGEVNPGTASLFATTLAASRAIGLYTAGGGSVVRVGNNATPAA